jgi:hypothetical protein
LPLTHVDQISGSRATILSKSRYSYFQSQFLEAESYTRDDYHHTYLRLWVWVIFTSYAGRAFVTSSSSASWPGLRRVVDSPWSLTRQSRGGHIWRNLLTSIHPNKASTMKRFRKTLPDDGKCQRIQDNTRLEVLAQIHDSKPKLNFTKELFFCKS